ncbi:MAG TPA: glutamyl-tRNA amidotransferase [Sphingobacteriaceae bacterium]|nr:glutamyl-tRNA amidotransferase [Sphingobacteriaceae bacterium]
MALQEKIDQQIKTAMLAKDNVRLRGLRAIKAAILLAKSEKGAAEMPGEEMEIKILQKLVKQRKESADIYKTQNRQDLYQIEAEELEIIESFLPKQLDRAEIINYVREIILKTGATNLKDMGKVIGLANKELAGRADGKAVSEAVKELLS